MTRTILFLGHEASRTGAPRSLLNIAIQVKQQLSIQPLFLLQNGGSLYSAYQQVGEVLVWKDPYPILPLWQRIGRRLFLPPGRRQKRILRKIAIQHPSLIFCNTVLNGQMLERLLFLQVPVVTRVPELEYVIRLFNKDLSATKTFQYSDHIVAVADAVKENLIANHQVDEQKISVIYGAISEQQSESLQNPDDLRDQLGIPKDNVVVGMCGTLIWRKGPDLFLRVAQYVQSQSLNIGVTFTWVGGNKHSAAWLEYQRELELLGLGNVIITGEVEDTSAYYTIMDIFLMTSREDPFPLVNLEAASHGVPIICFERSGGSVEFVDDTIGAIVGYSDAKAMARKVIEWIEDPNLRQTKGAMAREKVDRFKAHTMGQQVAEILTQLLINGQ